MAEKKSKKTSTGLNRALAAEMKRFRECVAARCLLPSLKADVGKLLKVAFRPRAMMSDLVGSRSTNSHLGLGGMQPAPDHYHENRRLLDKLFQE